MIDYVVNDKSMTAEQFLEMVNQVWPGSYDMELTRTALSKTRNITARDGSKLVGCVRVLTDGYYFGTITELLVIPEYQHQGIGSTLIQLVKEHTPTSLFFGAQPGKEPFYDKNGLQQGMQSYVITKRRP